MRGPCPPCLSFANRGCQSFAECWRAVAASLCQWIVWIGGFGMCLHIEHKSCLASQGSWQSGQARRPCLPHAAQLVGS